MFLQKNNIKIFFLAIIFSSFFSAVKNSQAATYYVDYESGLDFNAGTSVEAPWKHSPGDANATGNANRALQAGDTVYFKGGVYYRGQVVIDRKNGSEGSPITLKGDGWGTEKAIFDGSTPILSSFTKCQSANDCGGNPDYNNVYYTDLPVGAYPYDVGFYEDDEFLWYAQDPNPADAMFYDRTQDLRVIPQNDPVINYTRTSVTDPRYFTQSSVSFWNGAYVIAWRNPNMMATKKITSYDPATTTVYFDDLGDSVYTDRDSYYSVLNHPSLIDNEGEFALNEATGRFYVWPRGNTISHTYSVQTMDTGIYANSSKYVTIEGFVVQKYVMGIRALNGGSGILAENIIIKNNEVRKLKANDWYAIQVDGNTMIVENNRIEDCPRAVGILGGGDGVVVRNNYVKRSTRVGIWFMEALNSSITNNTVLECKGTHANGMSVYLNSQDVTVNANRVSDSNIAFTFQTGNNINITNNIFLGDGITTKVVANWGNMTGVVNFFNNIVLGSSNHAAVSLGSTADTAEFNFKNNIIDGGGRGNRSNNIYVGLSWDQDSDYGWNLGIGEIVESNQVNIFQNPASGDYRLKLGSPAINAGADLSAHFTADYAGVVRLPGAWDIGAYEFVDNDVTPPANPTDLVVN